MPGVQGQGLWSDFAQSYSKQIGLLKTNGYLHWVINAFFHAYNLGGRDE